MWELRHTIKNVIDRVIVYIFGYTDKFNFKPDASNNLPKKVLSTR